jgi:hypothetical protein
MKDIESSANFSAGLLVHVHIYMLLQCVDKSLYVDIVLSGVFGVILEGIRYSFSIVGVSTHIISCLTLSVSLSFRTSFRSVTNVTGRLWNKAS